MSAEYEKPEFIFLKQEDVAICGGGDMRLALADVERAFVMRAKDEIMQPIKTRLEFFNEDKTVRERYCVSMPIYLGGDIKRAGVKWAAESMLNVRLGNLPYGIDFMILHDLDRAHPVAMMDCTLITDMRTAAVAGLGAKYFARKDSKSAGFIGAGVVGKRVVEAIALSVPSLEEFRLFDLNKERALEVAELFKGRWKIQVVDSLQDAFEGADVVASATTTRVPFIKANWFKKGVFFAGMGANEIEEDGYSIMDTIAVDAWDAIQYYGETSNLVKMYKAGKFKCEITHIQDVVLSGVSGRKNPDHRIMINTMGMACEDMIIAERIYQKAKSLGLGQTLSLWDHSCL
jgi:ornithine cyclodeaminase/alanine dehydrogenase-like protein (mu-crystallin family)